MALDRVKDPLFRIARAAMPGLDYLTTYRARVIAEKPSPDGSQTVDLLPDDTRIPPMSGVRLKLGLPATSVSFAPGARVQLGWEGGDPARPYAALFDGGEADSFKLVIKAAQLFLGDETTAQPAIMGAAFRSAQTIQSQVIVNAAIAVASALSAAAADLPPSGTFGSVYPNVGALIATIGAWIAATAGATAGFEAGAAAYLAPRARVA